MKTTSDAIDMVYTDLVATGITAVLTGKVYKITKPLNSQKEDVVVNAIAITTGNPQRCALNVNVYVNNLNVNGDTTMPNYARLNQLLVYATQLQHMASATHYYYIRSQQIDKSEVSGQHVANVRIEMILLNN